MSYQIFDKRSQEREEGKDVEAYKTGLRQQISSYGYTANLVSGSLGGYQGTVTTTTGTISPSAYTTVTTSSGVTISYVPSSVFDGVRYKTESKKSKQETDDLVNIWTKVSEQ